MPVRPNTPPDDPRPTKASRARIWTPFVIGSVVGTLAFLSAARISVFLGWSGTLGSAFAAVAAGAVIGLVAGLASRTWAGLMTLVLGLIVAGLAAAVIAMVTDRYATDDIVPSAVSRAFALGLLGVPTYAVVTGIAHLIRWAARAGGPPERPA